MEEARANGESVSAEDINSVRTGLMGPVAGIGDTVMQGILFPILAGIRLYHGSGPEFGRTGILYGIV